MMIMDEVSKHYSWSMFPVLNITEALFAIL